MKLLLITLFATAASAMIAPLYKSQEKIEDSYIVVFLDGVDTMASIKEIENIPFFKSLGGRVDSVYRKVLNGFAATMSSKIVEMVRRLQFVKYVQEDQIMRANAVASWGLDRIDQRDLPLNDIYAPSNNGLGVHVYVIDTGINPTHVDFGSRATSASDHVTLKANNGVDCNGHGTHCAGTVGGTTYGVAVSVNLYGVRVLGCTGSGSSREVIAGMDWVASHHIQPAVASMSLGGGENVAIDDAVTRLDNVGVTVVVAAGNNNESACNYSPARAAEAYCVGATDKFDKRANFSNYGSCVKIFAPGVNITSAWYNSNQASVTISGTSMACPHVAGAAALILSADNTLTPKDVQDNLTRDASGNKVTDPGTGSPNLLLFVN